MSQRSKKEMRSPRLKKVIDSLPRDGDVDYIKKVLAERGVTYMFETTTSRTVAAVIKKWDSLGWTEFHFTTLGPEAISVVAYRDDKTGPPKVIVSVLNALADGGFAPDEIAKLVPFHPHSDLHA